MLVCCHLVVLFVASMLVIRSTSALRVGVHDFIADNNSTSALAFLATKWIWRIVYHTKSYPIQ